MRIDTPELAEVGELADMWVDLARGQRAHGSHLLASANRTAIREALARDAVAGTVRVAYDPTPVGFVAFGLDRGSYERDVTVGVVRNLYVRSGHRDEGVGSALLEAAERALAKKGADVIRLEAMARNADARRFYDRHGYHAHRVQFEKHVETDTRERE